MLNILKFMRNIEYITKHTIDDLKQRPKILCIIKYILFKYQNRKPQLVKR